MGTVFSFQLRDIDDPAILTPVIDRLHEIDAVYSPYRHDSVITQLDRGELDQGGAPEEVQRVLAAAREWSSRTGGWFDLTATGRLDPSGYVKGWAIDQASRMLTGAGSGWHCVNGGGDILAVAPAAARPWRFGIADPLDSRRLRGTATGHRVALATSGVTQRGGHIYDPFTGRPATSSLLSLSISGTDIIECDVLATAGFAAGTARAEWLSKMPGVQVLACQADGSTTPRPRARFSAAGW